jgi:hypothetical protein
MTRSRTQLVALRNAPPGTMPHYPADFTTCGCGVYNHSGCAAALVVRTSLKGRKCVTCGATWEGDRKRHRGMPLVPSGRPSAGGARGPR